jgi:hypothetical protein
MQHGSRNNYNNFRHTQAWKKGAEAFFSPNLPHGDTINRVLKQLPQQQIELLKQRYISSLIRSKKLEHLRIDHYFHICIDGTGLYASQNPVPSRTTQADCSTNTAKDAGICRNYSSGAKTYLYPVLEAKIVGYDGMALSIGSEFIDNQKVSWEDNKQDCELKAFKRLAERIATQFPRLPICLLLDALYAKETVFDICRENNWKFIINLQDSNLINFHRNIQQREREIIESACKVDKVTTRCRALNAVPHKTELYNWFSATETIAHKGEKKFEYITNLSVYQNNLMNRLRRARLRWKIENEGFNIQKNNGYQAQHRCCRIDTQTQENYYQMLQIAHIINQLAHRAKPFTQILQAKPKLTIKNIWVRMSNLLSFALVIQQYILLE